MIGSIQDKLSPDSIVLWTAVVEKRVSKVRHAFTAQAVPTAEEHCVLQRQRKEKSRRRMGTKGTIHRECKEFFCLIQMSKKTIQAIQHKNMYPDISSIQFQITFDLEKKTKPIKNTQFTLGSTATELISTAL